MLDKRNIAVATLKGDKITIDIQDIDKAQEIYRSVSMMKSALRRIVSILQENIMEVTDTYEEYVEMVNKEVVADDEKLGSMLVKLYSSESIENDLNAYVLDVIDRLTEENKL